MFVTDVLGNERTTELHFGRGGYFMSEEEEKQARAMVLLESTEARKHLAILTEEATRLGREFRRLGEALENRPALLSFDGESMNVQYALKREDFKATLLDAKKLAALAADIRKTQSESERLSQRVRELGLS